MRLHLLLLFMTLQAAVPQQETLIVERGRAGAVAIGATADSVHGAFRERAKLVDLGLEGHLSPAIEIKRFSMQLIPSIVAEIGASGDALIVTRISVLDPGFKTTAGVGVGSTYAELRAAYKIDRVGSGEGDFFARVEELGISFQLDTSGQLPLWSLRDPARVPPAVRITRMLLTR